MAKSRSRRKEIDEVLSAAEKEGWVIARSSGHTKCKSPDGEHLIVVSSSPADPRAILNIRSMFRKAGVAV